MNKPKIEVYVNNNPKCSTVIESTSKNEVWNMTNEPYVLVNVKNIDNGSKQIVVKIEEKVLFNDMVVIEDNEFTKKIDLLETINNIHRVFVEINNKPHDIPVNIHKIYGKATYLNGTPVINPIVYNLKRNVIAVGDDDGNYEISTCGNEDILAFLAESYSKETLETWFYNVDIDDNLKLNIIIDKMELYRIHMWSGEQSDYIHFIPMSLKRIQHALSMPFTSQLEMLSYNDMWPTLNKENVKVFANDQIAPILMFQEVPDITSEVNGVMYSRPSYIMSIPKGFNNSLIKVTIESDFEIDNITYSEKGEGYYWWKS